MTTISRECARALYITELIREHLDTVLIALIAAGEHQLAGHLASRCGTTTAWELGGRQGGDAVRAAGIRAGRARAVADMRAIIRAELAKLKITSPVQLADYFAQVTREAGR